MPAKFRTHAEVKAELFKDPAFRQAYEALEPAYQLARLRIERRIAGLAGGQNMTHAQRRAFARHVCSKRIVEVRFDGEEGDTGDKPLTGFDLVFDDGSEIELYAPDDGLGYVLVTAEEAAEHRREAEDMEREATIKMAS